jgi:hypothetical protein
VEVKSIADIRDFYERHAQDFDSDRSRNLQERTWLDRFLSYVAPGGTVFDIGYGMAEPIARYIIERGCDVVGPGFVVFANAATT